MFTSGVLKGRTIVYQASRERTSGRVRILLPIECEALITAPLPHRLIATDMPNQDVLEQTRMTSNNKPRGETPKVWALHRVEIDARCRDIDIVTKLVCNGQSIISS